MAHYVLPPGRSGAGPLDLALRVGTTDDYAAVRDLHRRCSAASRALRYHCGTPELRPRIWQQLSDPRAGCTLLVSLTVPPHHTVAVGHLLGTNTPGSAELALLVEDRWQSRGIGTALADCLFDLARSIGVHSVSFVSGAGNCRAQRIARHLAARAADTARTADAPRAAVTLALA
ncbi:GNAT family N-acetyltransferase [Streptomyces monticola]|uniref:GNAT family N-acetyltransferase n=1 Tax=Streptomyces monticola TaxID=2666263 RepID=A0ABW2JYU2_9ACTN